ncbi:MAG: hypothetical protein R3E48_00460 [Burkholderiaceae bacterium]
MTDSSQGNGQAPRGDRDSTRRLSALAAALGVSLGVAPQVTLAVSQESPTTSVQVAAEPDGNAAMLLAATPLKDGASGKPATRVMKIPGVTGKPAARSLKYGDITVKSRQPKAKAQARSAKPAVRSGKVDLKNPTRAQKIERKAPAQSVKTDRNK